MKDLTELRKIAEQATPGPWEPYDANEGMDRAYSPMWCVANEEFHNPTTGDDEDWMGVEIYVGDKADSDHIATFDPPTVLALLTRLEQAEQAVARVRELADNARATKHESTEYLHPLEILLALDGHTKQLGGTPTGDFAYVCSCGKSYWPCSALDGEQV